MLVVAQGVNGNGLGLYDISPNHANPIVGPVDTVARILSLAERLPWATAS